MAQLQDNHSARRLSRPSSEDSHGQDKKQTCCNVAITTHVGGIVFTSVRLWVCTPEPFEISS